MTKDKPNSPDFSELRRQAEERFAARQRETGQPPGYIEKLLHELQVHQIELELQNEELRHTQVQLQESLMEFTDLYDFAPVGYLTLNEEGLILKANLAGAALLGVERSNLMNRPLRTFIANESRAGFDDFRKTIFKTLTKQTHEVKLMTKGNFLAHALIEGIALEDKQESEKQCRIAVIDITDRKLAEVALRRAHDELEERVRERTAELEGANVQLSREVLERQKTQTALQMESDSLRKLSQEFHTLLNAISDTLILLSPDMGILWTNCENAQPLNEAQSGVVRQHCHELLQDLSASSAGSPVRRCFNNGEKEVWMVTHNGIVLDVRAFPVKEGDRVGSVLLLASDITEKMALQAEAMQTLHLATLGELVAGIAHEINNPITGIINCGQILINECSAESMENDIGKRIVKEGERIGHIVKTLLSYARDDERERRKDTYVSTLLEESTILTQAQIRKEGIELKINLLDDLPEVNVNVQQIQQCFINIISNARYALNEKYPGRHKDKLLEITAEKVIISDHPYVRIVFHDQGVGISPRELPLLTKPFFTTKPIGKGTGLGLSITDRIITDHGGFLSFESLKGEFTKVIIDLPAYVTCNTEIT
jgi:two-component system, NtrC family, sensor kinase